MNSVFLIVQDRIMTGGGSRILAAYSSREEAQSALDRWRSQWRGVTSTVSMAAYTIQELPVDKHFDSIPE